jgi:hypothetical protein
MLIVVAGNHDQYRDYLKARGIEPKRAAYVASADTLVAFRRAEAVLTGTWHERADIGAVMEAMRVRRITWRRDPY